MKRMSIITRTLLGGGLGLLLAFALAGHAAAQATCVAPPSGLVSWWPGDGNADDIVGGDNGTLENGATFTDEVTTFGKVGQAFILDGVDDGVNGAGDGHVKVAASANLDVGAGNGFTIDAWINPADVSKARPIIEWDVGFGIFPGVHLWLGVNPFGGNFPGALFANIVGTGPTNHIFVSSGGVLLPNVDQHIALTYDKTTGFARLYVDGMQVAQSNFGSFRPQTSTAFDLYFGIRFANPGPFRSYKGTLDEVEIFDRALTAAEIQAIFNADIAGKCKVTEVAIDIKPGSCPNPLNVKSKGVLPVAILGTANFDATQVDLTTVTLKGVSPLRSNLEDVATPFDPFTGKENALDCNEDAGDGLTDLTLKFDRQAVVGALGAVNDGDVIVVPVSGKLLDGTTFDGEDVIVIKKK